MNFKIDMRFYKGMIIGALLLGVNTLSLGFDIENWQSEFLKENKISERIQETRKRKRFRSEIRDEKRDLDFDRSEVNQVKQWDARLNRVLTDIHGNRVRVQQFITRPESNQVKFTAVTKRKNRLDYMWFLQEFNGDLPKDIKGIAFRSEWSIDEKPALYPITQTKYLSNTIDSIGTIWEDGKPEEIENRDGENFWSIWPGRYTLKINSQIKVTLDYSDSSYQPGESEYSYDRFSDGGDWKRYDYPWDDTFLYRERRFFDNKGNKISIWFESSESIAKIQNDYNLEYIYTASEFNGRKIDIIFIPKIFLQFVPKDSICGFNPYLYY